jgi:histidinol dehydrogenase
MMKIINFPPGETWEALGSRPMADNSETDNIVKEILRKVKSDGDKALRNYSGKYDGVKVDVFRVSDKELEESAYSIPDDLKEAIGIARKNIWNFHKSQLAVEQVLETMPGVKCWRKNIAIEIVGLYIPGGSAPLFSTVLMLAIPAKIAGCTRIVLCTPPGEDGKINPVILFTAWLTGIKEVYKAGGAQAIAAMAYGTESIPKVFKIFGPGNLYVTRAKEMVQAEGVAIDMPAGPSEVLVIADSTANPEFVAADILSQAEHGRDSQVILLSNDDNLITKVLREINSQLKLLPRRNIAEQSLAKSLAIRLKDLDECMAFSNMYAPEHLIINTGNPEILAEKVINAGSVFLGEYSCESCGDYASGTNHTLPTNGFARSYSGVSAESFTRKITFQEISRSGIENIGPAVEKMAKAENLAGHKNAVSVRLKKKKNGWFR